MFISLFFLALHFTGCDSVFPDIPDLTPEEVQLLEKHSYDSNCVVRWPTGSIIEVYDETNFTQLNYVLDEWNKVLAGSVSLVIVDKLFGSEVQIIQKNLEGTLAGHATIWWSDKKIYKGLIEIDPEITNELHVYLHEFGHILGFANHFDEGIMVSKITELTYIDQKTEDYFLLLYLLPVGYYF